MVYHFWETSAEAERRCEEEEEIEGMNEIVKKNCGRNLFT